MSTQETKLKDIADAIRVKEGSSDPIIANDFPARIAAIQTGTDTSDATATAGDILSGETAYVASGKVTGTIPTRTESNISVSGPTIIVPSGYYGSQVSKSVATATQATPTISVNSSGLITASSTQSAGYVTAGTKNATRQLTTQAGKTITPSRTQQTAVSSGRYTTGNIYVAGDTDLVASNIKSGVNIFGVAGTYEGPRFYMDTWSKEEGRDIENGSVAGLSFGNFGTSSFYLNATLTYTPVLIIAAAIEFWDGYYGSATPFKASACEIGYGYPTDGGIDPTTTDSVGGGGDEAGNTKSPILSIPSSASGTMITLQIRSYTSSWGIRYPEDVLIHTLAIMYLY